MHYSRKYTYLACLALLCLAVLSACGGQLVADVKMYDFVYDSGYSRDPYTKDERQPVIGSDLQLMITEDAKLLVLDEQGGELYGVAEYQPELSRSGGLDLTVRGETAARGIIIASGGIFQPYDEELGEGALWLCCEAWAKSSYNGFIDGTLRGGRLLLLNAASGGTVFSADTQPGELFLTASGNRCYFYYCGKSSRRRDDSRPAQIYWRDINCWPLTHQVCAFDYAGTPEFAGQEMERLRFYPQEDLLRLDFTCYEQTNAENDRWDYVVKNSVEVPLTLQPPIEEADEPENE